MSFNPTPTSPALPEDFGLPEDVVARPMSFISELVSISLQAAAESEKQYAALAAAEGRAIEAPVEIVVAPTGEVRSLAFLEDPSLRSPNATGTAIMRAYRRAAATANAAVAAGAPPDLLSTILGSVPGEVAAQRAQEGEEEAPSGTPVPYQVRPSAPPTVADLPADAQLDEFLAILDDPDPFRAVERLRSAPGLTRVDLSSRSAAEVDAEIRAEIQAISDRGEVLGPQLREIRGVAQNQDGIVEVDAWGGLVAVELTTAIRTKQARELEASLARLIADATAEASGRAAALLRGTGFDDPSDPVVADLRRKQRGQTR